MYKIIYNQQDNSWLKPFRWLHFIIGANLILFSILIFIYPQILAFLFGGMLLMGGIAVIALGMGIRNKFKAFSGRYRNIKVE